DGATGTEIYKRGFFTNQCYDELNLRLPKIIAEIAASYVDVGVDVVTTNTYGANRFALEKYGLEAQVEAINVAGVKIVREVAAAAERRIFIAGSVGFPTQGTLNNRGRDEIVAGFRAQIDALIAAGVDFIMFETQPSRDVAEIVVEAMGDAANFPFVLSYSLNSTLFAAPNTLESRAKRFATFFAPFSGPAQPIAWGLNCGLGPEGALAATKEIVKTIDLPLIVQPNAGEPQEVDGRHLYYNSPEYFATYAMRFVELGAAAIGGCCGVSAKEIAELVKMVKPLAQGRKSKITLIAAENDVVELPEKPVAERSRLAEKLSRGEWVSTVETIPPRGFDLRDFIDKGRRLKEAGVDAVVAEG
ncbi:MAG: homocysteine S-methyltransferase family protein, partial [Thermoguttaceae bacterium]|nr:homocysteine S-methyltransferase family protein [Thermoguttaceae bacterium]